MPAREARLGSCNVEPKHPLRPADPIVDSLNDDEAEQLAQHQTMLTDPTATISQQIDARASIDELLDRADPPLRGSQQGA